jgi:hypothetical protein
VLTTSSTRRSVSIGRTTAGSVTVTSTALPSAGSVGIRIGETAEPGRILAPSGPTS